MRLLAAALLAASLFVVGGDVALGQLGQSFQAPAVHPTHAQLVWFSADGGAARHKCHRSKTHKCPRPKPVTCPAWFAHRHLCNGEW